MDFQYLCTWELLPGMLALFIQLLKVRNPSLFSNTAYSRRRTAPRFKLSLLPGAAGAQRYPYHWA